MPPSEPLTDLPQLAATETIPPLAASFPAANGNAGTALAPAPTGEPPVPPAAVPPAALSLEQRIQRLEEAVSSLQEQRQRTLLAAPAPPAPTAIRLDVGKQPQTPAAPVATAIVAPVAEIVPTVHRSGALWLLWDTWAEARAIVRMFVDPRYHLPRSARVLPLVLLAVILTSNIWVPFSSVPVLGGLLVNLVDLLLAFLLFKWLGHEARRYRQTSPDLPANLRL